MNRDKEDASGDAVVNELRHQSGNNEPTAYLVTFSDPTVRPDLILPDAVPYYRRAYKDSTLTPLYVERHQVCNDDTARMDFLSRGSAFTDHREEDLLRSDTPLGKAVLFSYDGVRYFAKGETLREAVDAAMKRDAELRHVAGKKP